MNLTHRAPALTFSALVLLVFSSASLAQQTFKIAKIEFDGLKRVDADEIRSRAGLNVGDPFEETAADAAAQRLIDSGLFKNVGYKTITVGDQLTITFRVEERDLASSRVVFDNFIWFTDTELIGAVRREIPSFSGSAPDNGDMVDRITKALQRFLHENKIEVTVSYMTSQDSADSTTQEHVFSVTGVPMPICSIHFVGAKQIDEAKLIESSKPLFGTDYSYKIVGGFTLKNLVPIYRERGLLKATFAPPSAKPEASATCKAGVDLTLAVEEGLIYKWDKAEWSGISALTTHELETAIDMESDQPANGLKIDMMGAAIRRAYSRKGYVLARSRQYPNLDDASQKVSYKLDVVEGPQFRMGHLILKGFPADTSKAFNEKWKLKAGEVFDAVYLDEFSKKPMTEVLRGLYFERREKGKAPPNVRTSVAPNRASLTVDVTIELTN